MNELQVLDVKVVTKEGSIQFKNYEELKAMVSAALTKYEGVTLTDDNKQEIKSMGTELNKLDTELNRRRIDLKKEYMKPFELFEDQVKEISGQIQEARTKLTAQVKEAEDLEKEQKSKEVEEYFNELKVAEGIEWVKYEDMNLNVTLSVSVTNLKKQVKEKIDGIVLDLEEIKTDPNSDRLAAKYFLSKNLQQSRIELNRELQQEAALKEAQANIKEETVEPTKPVEQPKVEQVYERFTFTLKNVTRSQLLEIRDYIEQKGIEYE